MSPTRPTAVIIGAGPAGLTAAYELVTRTDVVPVVVEAGPRVGGLSCTVEHNGNRIDIGGHRFFSKSDRVMDWWTRMMPVQRTGLAPFDIAYQGQRRTVGASDGPDPGTEDRVLLVRSRRSRIYWRRRLFDYPLSLSADTVRKLGVRTMGRAAASYGRARLFPERDEQNLEQFLVNRFGRELYRTFFESYTEKVWGIPCDQISADWGAQRIKGLSVRTAVAHALRRGPGDLRQRDVETSLIERFLYPKYGPGQMWECVADEVRRRGGQVRLNERAVGLSVERDRVVGVTTHRTAPDGRLAGHADDLDADHVVSSMPVPALVDSLRAPVPAPARRVADGLRFRDFITVGLLVDRLRLTRDDGGPIDDNWIYVQEPGVEIGRLQIFNNWSPWMVADPSRVWLGLEYFCSWTDPIWHRGDAELIAMGADELARLGIIDRGAVLDGTVLRVPRAYPAYFGSYDRFGDVREFLDGFANLTCVGRNGQHRYNNQDHSMLSAMAAVDGIAAGRPAKREVWAVNAEKEYLETRS